MKHGPSPFRADARTPGAMDDFNDEVALPTLPVVSKSLVALALLVCGMPVVAYLVLPVSTTVRPAVITSCSANGVLQTECTGIVLVESGDRAELGMAVEVRREKGATTVQGRIIPVSSLPVDGLRIDEVVRLVGGNGMPKTPTALGLRVVATSLATGESVVVALPRPPQGSSSLWRLIFKGAP